MCHAMFSASHSFRLCQNIGTFGFHQSPSAVRGVRVWPAENASVR